MPGLLVLVVYALAVARVTRFITRDRLFEGPREAFEARAYRRAYPTDIHGPESLRLAMVTKPTPLLAYLIGCPWCVSIWVGLAAAPIALYAPHAPWFAIPALGLALSHVTGYLASKEG